MEAHHHKGGKTEGLKPITGGEKEQRQFIIGFMNRHLNHLFILGLENVVEFFVGTTKAIITPPMYEPLAENSSLLKEEPPETYFYNSPNIPDFFWKKLFITPTGRCISSFRFPSAYTSPHPENNIVYGIADQPASGKSRGAIIFIHGHGMNSFSVLEILSLPLLQAGFEVYYLALPYHMQRTPRGSWSGHYSLCADIESSGWAFQQGVIDTRTLMSWIIKERGLPVALAGVSLGGFTSLMTSVVDDRPFAVISIVGGGSLAQVMFTGYPMRAARAELLRHGIDQIQLEKAWKKLAPAQYQTRLKKEQILLIGAQYDQVVCPSNVELIWNTWDRPPIRWYPCGHTTIAFHRKDISNDMLKILNQWCPNPETD